jgi:hypothetical protein
MRVLRKALNEIAKLMEKHASVAQGKGWGSSTVEKEVAALFDLLKTPPPNLYRHWGQRRKLYSSFETQERGLFNLRF